MNIKKFSRRVLLLGLIGLLGSSLLSFSTASVALEKLENAACLNCHENSKDKLQSAVPEGSEAHELETIVASKFGASVHAKLPCISCHLEISDSPEANQSHQKDPLKKAARPNCISCHEDLWTKLKQEGKTQEHPRFGVVVENIASYKKSLHARPSQDDNTRANASCADCHSSHSFNVPPKNSPQHAAFRLAIPATCGEKCHEESLEKYADSIHGKETLEKHNVKSAVCSDCHSAHAVANTSGTPAKLAITAQCGSCHEANYKSYKGTYHGQISTLGYAYTAKCFDCHGSHNILAALDPKSKVHANNRMKTCKECHSGKKELPIAPPGFASFQPHGHAGDFKRYPEIFIAKQIMIQLLVGTFGFFWLHTLLWFYREFKERKQSKERRRVKREALPGHLQGKHVKRFSRTWRIAHILFALSLMILTLTGIPLFYPDAPWASGLMALLGGPHIAGLIHRSNAVIFAGVFFWHLAYMGLNIARNWKNFKLFGPDSLIPNLKDARDMLGMFKWFFGKGPRPAFDRWTYWEKFDYWAPFWGVTIIGVSGLIMWLPNLSANYLPGWVFNVAAIFHSEEAFLAVVFLFTVHFFNNHFRPDKFPLGEVMFTGSFSLEEFMHDHHLEYLRLQASGELEKYLVDAPSSLRSKASKLLGFVLITLGLSLLTLVGIGFFTS